MADTVNLFGSQVKKGYVIAGGGVVVVAVGYGWWKNRQQAAANASAPSTASTPAASTSGLYDGLDSGIGTDPYPPDGTTGDPSDPNSTDPSTGQTYGDEGAFSSGYGALGDDSYDGYGTTAYYPPGVTGSTSYTSNAQWAQAAEQYLTGTVGSDATTISAALGKYLTGQAVTSDQVSVIQQAIAFVGYPPVQGPDGFPPSIQTAATSTAPTGGTTGTTGKAPASAPGSISVTPHPGTADMSWGPVSGADNYEYVITGAGGKGTGTSHVDKQTSGTHAEGITLNQGKYIARVRARNGTGYGPWSLNKPFTVTAPPRDIGRK